MSRASMAEELFRVELLRSVRDLAVAINRVADAMPGNPDHPRENEPKEEAPDFSEVEPGPKFKD